VFVKICGMTRAGDVADAVRAGADALGFVFAPSARQVTPEQAAGISRDLPARVLRVAVMLNPTNDDWQAVADRFRPDVLQTDAGDFGNLDVDAAVRRWPVYRQGGPGLDYPSLGEYVYEGVLSGTGNTVDWEEAAMVARHGRMVLAGGLNPDNVADAIAMVRPWGVDASSGLESAPGQKDGDRMAAFVAAARRAAKNQGQAHGVNGPESGE